MILEKKILEETSTKHFKESIFEKVASYLLLKRSPKRTCFDGILQIA